MTARNITVFPIRSPIRTPDLDQSEIYIADGFTNAYFMWGACAPSGWEPLAELFEAIVKVALETAPAANVPA